MNSAYSYWKRSIVEKFTEKSIIINQFSYFQAENEVKISKNTNTSLQKFMTRSAKVSPESSNYLIPPKVHNFYLPLFRRGVWAMKNKRFKGIEWNNYKIWITYLSSWFQNLLLFFLHYLFTTPRCPSVDANYRNRYCINTFIFKSIEPGDCMGVWAVSAVFLWKSGVFRLSI